MSNTSKKIVSEIGIIIGVIIVVIGFNLQDTSNYSIGDSIKFGADFYTEMYDVTKDVGKAINYAINDLICAISWLIISLGAIDICFFAYKLVKANEVSNSHIVGALAEENAVRKVEKSDKHEVKEQTTSKPTVSKSNELHELEKKQYVNDAMNRRTHSTAPYWCGKCGHEGPYDGSCPNCNSSLKKYNVKPKQDVINQAKGEAENTTWVCEKCNTKNLSSNSACWSCNHPR